jgi:hypothetical protein
MGENVIGYLHIGKIRTEITSVSFSGDCMVVKVTLGPEVSGELKGHVQIEGLDGTTCWRGTKHHDYGVKLASGPYGPSTWDITLNADLYDRTNATIIARYQEAGAGGGDAGGVTSALTLVVAESSEDWMPCALVTSASSELVSTDPVLASWVWMAVASVTREAVCVETSSSIELMAATSVWICCSLMRTWFTFPAI